jgi:hypothetical protein
MVTTTLSTHEGLHTLIKAHSEIKWSEVARKAMWTQARKLQMMDSILADSDLTEEDALAFGKKINREIAKKHRLTR